MLEEQINKHFLLPIDFISNTYETPENLYDDLELIETKDNSNNSLYEKLFTPTTPFGHLTLAKTTKKVHNKHSVFKKYSKITEKK